MNLKNILVLVGSHINFNSMQSALKWIQLINISFIFLLDIIQMPTLYVMEKLLLNYLILNVNLAIRKAWKCEIYSCLKWKMQGHYNLLK